MAREGLNGKDEKITELATFYLGDTLCGIDIKSIQEINKLIDMTQVPQAPDYVLGVLNLRGEIVTVIDLGRKLGLSPANITPDSRNIIINYQNENVGLLVDKIGDVVEVDTKKIEPAPANLEEIQGSFFEGVLKDEKVLVGILNLDEALKDNDQ